MFFLKGNASSPTNTPFVGKFRVFVCRASLNVDLEKTRASFTLPFVPTSM
jgi:hypothetical protein